MGMTETTERLYERDAYLRAFTARVTSCVREKDGWAVTLDRTAFYPEGGGQPADTGTLGGARVTDVRARDGGIVHLTGAPLPVGERTEGEIDWARRFSLMQNHTGEHIVSGWIHRLYGLDNVGFHMGHDAVTIDFNGFLSADALARVEALANQTVYDNLPVVTDCPPPDALETLDYRSKKALSGAVRIVTIPGCDVCACCGTHLARTGETGAVKLLSAQRYKGGVRVWMLCGSRAMADYTAKNESVSAISVLLSAKPHEVVQAVERMLDENETMKQRINALQGEAFARIAQAVPSGTARICLFERELAPGELRRLCLLLCERCGVAAVFSGDDKTGYRYAVGSLREDVRPLGKRLNGEFSGRGGGARELVQGSLSASKEGLDAFFNAL